jgi:hypothetical protein
MRRHLMGLSTFLPLAHHAHALNNRGQCEDEVQLDASWATCADGSWCPTALKSPTAAMTLPRAPLQCLKDTAEPRPWPICQRLTRLDTLADYCGSGAKSGDSIK